MRITVTTSVSDTNPHVCTVERPSEDMEPYDILELALNALRGFGFSDDTIHAGIAAYLAQNMVVEDEHIAHA
jgi:hypothetical protein